MNTKTIIRTSALVAGLFFLLYMLFITVKSSYALSVGVAANTNYHLAMNEALNQEKTISNTYEISKEISVYSLYLPYLSYLERHNRYFRKCDIVNNPKTLNSFISGVKTRYGVDLYALEDMQKMGEVGAKNRMIRQHKVKRYMQCVASYGLIIAQAIDNFHNSLENGAGSVMSNDVFRISDNAFYNEIGQSLYDAIIHQSGRLRTQYDIMKRQIKDNTCVIYNQSLKCGDVAADSRKLVACGVRRIKVSLFGKERLKVCVYNARFDGNEHILFV